MKSLLVRVGVIFVAFVLAGCASGHWYKPDMTEEQFKKDHYACWRDLQAPNRWPDGNVMFKQCMESKGYQWIK